LTAAVAFDANYLDRLPDVECATALAKLAGLVVNGRCVRTDG